MSDEFFDWADVRAELLGPEDEPEVTRLRETLRAAARDRPRAIHEDEQRE